MNDFSLDHIGIAVESIETGKEFYSHLGFGEIKTEEVTSEGVRVGFVPMQNQADIELLEPTTEDSPIRKFLDKKGPGIHHICLRVKDIKSTMADLRAKGVLLLNEEPKMGAHNCLIAFVHPKSAGGVLVELSQKMSENSSGQESQ